MDAISVLVAKLLSSVIEGSITYGPYATFVTYLWLSERAERRIGQVTINKMYEDFGKEKDVMNERVYKALSDTTSAVGSTGQVLGTALTTLSTVKDLVMRQFQGGGTPHV